MRNIHMKYQTSRTHCSKKGQTPQSKSNGTCKKPTERDFQQTYPCEISKQSSSTSKVKVSDRFKEWHTRKKPIFALFFDLEGLKVQGHLPISFYNIVDKSPK